MNIRAAKHTHPAKSCLLALLVLVFGFAPLLAKAQQDRSAEKAQRRLQQQLQQTQQQLTQAQADKAKAEQDKASLEKQAKGRSQAASRALAAQRAKEQNLKQALAAKDELSQRIATLEKALEEERRNGNQRVTKKEMDLVRAKQDFDAKEAERQEWQNRFGEQARMVTQCADKNENLGKLSLELINRYRSKGVMEALYQKEPLVGLKDVQMFNLAQEYRDRADAERFTPSVERR
jgi:septal ring factor EnvC (AmiA/AmiB activator)